MVGQPRTSCFVHFFCSEQELREFVGDRFDFKVGKCPRKTKEEQAESQLRVDREVWKKLENKEKEWSDGLLDKLANFIVWLSMLSVMASFNLEVVQKEGKKLAADFPAIPTLFTVLKWTWNTLETHNSTTFVGLAADFVGNLCGKYGTLGQIAVTLLTGTFGVAASVAQYKGIDHNILATIILGIYLCCRCYATLVFAVASLTQFNTHANPKSSVHLGLRFMYTVYFVFAKLIYNVLAHYFPILVTGSTQIIVAVQSINLVFTVARKIIKANYKVQKSKKV